MRITSSMYYTNIFGSNNSKINQELFDVNKQISSGLKIEYASDDVTTFSETMRLDNELTTITQIKNSTESGSKVSDQTDSVLSEFEDNMTRMRTLVVQASNDTQDEDSRYAIVKELEGLEENLKSLANTSVNGKYLFAGTNTDVKPIDADGNYTGNDGTLNAFLGSNKTQQYNVSGSELFLGEESKRKRNVTSNVIQKNPENDEKITTSSTIRDLMGDKDGDENSVNTAYFYLRGTKSDGTAFNQKIALDDTKTVDNLLDEVAKAYGNTANTQLVNVSLNSDGEIVVEDKQSGSSRLDFHMVGAVDFDVATDENGDGNGDDADVDSIDLLDVGETDYDKIKNSTSTSNLYVKEFMLSDVQAAPDAPSNIDGLLYDRTQFTKDGSKLSSNVSQILKSDNSYATSSTKISEVADLSQGNVGTLDGTVFDLVGTDIHGNDYTATINFNSSDNGGSTFSVDTDGDGTVDTDYTIYDMGDPREAVDADEMTYQQLMDVTNMIVTNNLPASSPGSADEYDDAIKAANEEGSIALSYDGKIEFQDLTNEQSEATISLYDENSGSFGGDSSVMTFNTNTALTVSDPKTDFFKTIDKVIQAVENSSSYPDAKNGDKDAVGMENALSMMDDLLDHVSRVHSKVGAQSNSLNRSLERTSLLEMSTVSLRSSFIDTDLAEASLRLTQLNNNYEALLSSVGKVSKLSLVNYL